VRKASKESWRAFCNSINDLPTLSRDPKTKLGSLVTPSGLQTQSEGETLELLLETHFLDSVFTEEEVAPVAACHAKQCDWQVAAVICFPHIKVWEWMAYTWPCCSRDGRLSFHN
jgi:hypothetical protein